MTLQISQIESCWGGLVANDISRSLVVDAPGRLRWRARIFGIDAHARGE